MAESPASPNAGRAGTPPPMYASTYGATEAAPPAAPPAYTYYSQPIIADEPPPSYDSLYGRVQAAKAESSGVVEFLKKVIVIIFSTVYVTIVIAIFLAIPVAMIIIGSLYFHECPIEPYIPLYLVVGGCFGVLRNLSSVLQRIRNRQRNRTEDNAVTNPFDGIVGCFLVAWFVAGNIWIYRTYSNLTTSDPMQPTYCNPVVYWFAFWVITAAYIIAVAGCCCFCTCVFVCSMMPSSTANNP